MNFLYERLNVISDSRGLVFEPLASDAFFNQRNVHVVISLPGVVRGNHYHLKGEETIAVVGPALVRVREGNDIKNIEIPRETVYRFFFPPAMPHAIQNLSDQPNILVAFNTTEHDPQNPDTVRDVLI